MGITEEELSRMLACFGATVKKYKSGDMIIRQGDVVSKIYMILEGSVYIEKDSYWGRRIIVQKLNELNNIADMYAVHASQCLNLPIDEITNI